VLNRQTLHELLLTDAKASICDYKSIAMIAGTVEMEDVIVDFGGLLLPAPKWIK
jgi:hypothetical protein